MSDPGPALHPRDGEALEFALGTGSRGERLSFEREMARDPSLAAAVSAWEERLAPLAERLTPVEPARSLLSSIEGALDARGAPNVLPFSVPPELARLRRARTVWRAATAGASAIAASLALVLAFERPVPGEPAPGLVAVVNRSGDLPALIVRVDARDRVVQVRSVAAETPPASSLELWSIAPGGAPRSLGLVGQGLTRVRVPTGGPALDADVTLAVSVEPTGGSPIGSPTGPVVYSGKLLPE